MPYNRTIFGVGLLSLSSIYFSLLQFNETAGTVPDPSLPLPHQLEQALKTVREQSRTILEMQVTCKSVEEVIELLT